MLEIKPREQLIELKDLSTFLIAMSSPTTSFSNHALLASLIERVTAIDSKKATKAAARTASASSPFTSSSASLAPSWPQKPLSHVDGSHIVELKSIEEWKQNPPLNRNGQRAKIVYSVGANSDHRNAYHFLPKDVECELQDSLDNLFWQRDVRAFWCLDWQEASLFDIQSDDELTKGQKNEEGDYCFYESHALPFYLHYLFDRKYHLFELVSRSLISVNTLIDELIEWDKWRRSDHAIKIHSKLRVEHKDGVEEDQTEEQLDKQKEVSFREWLGSSRLEQDPSEEVQQTTAYRLVIPTSTDLIELWDQMLECDICVLPSVLLMNRSHTAKEWYAGLRLLEAQADCEIFPLLGVESRMEHKQLYLSHLLTKAPKYVTLEQREDDEIRRTILKEVGEEKKAEKTTVKQEFKSESKLKQEDDNDSSHDEGDDVLRISLLLDETNTSIKHNREYKQLPFTFSPEGNILGPTILIEASTIQCLNEYQRLDFMKHLLEQLEEEVTAGGWQVEKGGYIIKGCNSTRTNVMKRCTKAEEILSVIKQAMERGMKLCAANDAFILQPHMKGLLWEARTFFCKGRAMFTLINDQKNTIRSSYIGKQDPKLIASTFKMLDLRGFEHISESEYHLIQPKIIDFSCYLLTQCEKHCRLVSESGVCRVDLGVEFVKVDQRDKEAVVRSSNESAMYLLECRLRQQQKRPSDWQTTGGGFIVRFFLNEVTSTLDINWFSIQTRYPIVYEAAYATSQHLLRRLELRATAREEGLKTSRLLTDHMRQELEKNEDERAVRAEITERSLKDKRDAPGKKEVEKKNDLRGPKKPYNNDSVKEDAELDPIMQSLSHAEREGESEVREESASMERYRTRVQQRVAVQEKYEEKRIEFVEEDGGDVLSIGPVIYIPSEEYCEVDVSDIDEM